MVIYICLYPLCLLSTHLVSTFVHKPLYVPLVGLHEHPILLFNHPLRLKNHLLEVVLRTMILSAFSLVSRSIQKYLVGLSFSNFFVVSSTLNKSPLGQLFISFTFNRWKSVELWCTFPPYGLK